MWTSLIAAWMFAAPVALAQEVEQEVLVTSNPFARFDHTRWRVDYQLVMPYPFVMYATSNSELNAVAADVRMVIACDLAGRLGRRVQEVDCLIEDAAISAAPWYRKNPKGEQVLHGTRDLLKGLQVTLQVTADGRITNVGLVGEPQGIRRLNLTYENLRQLVRRAMVGFHLKASGRYTVGEQWVERNSELFSVPVFRRSNQLLRIPSSTREADGSTRTVGSALALFDAQSIDMTPQASAADLWSTLGQSGIESLQAPASYGWSVIGHRMDRYKGRYVVQSDGSGTVELGTDRHMTFRGTSTGVSVFDDAGIMTERRWSVELQPTASSILADGVAGWPYMFIGSLHKLGPDEVSEVGLSTLLSPPNSEARGNLPVWPAL